MEQPSAAKWNILGTNDASFNDGTGIADSSITAPKISTSTILLAYEEKTATQNFTSEAVITDLTLTFTVPSGGRLVRIEVHGYANNTASATQTIRLRENDISGTVVQSRPSFVAAITATESVSFSWCKELTAGTYTYVVTGAAASGTATWQGGSTAPSYALATLF